MIISSEKQMLKVANKLGSGLVNNLNQNFIIYLKGELGSGKTTFSKGLIKGMGYQELITSPMIIEWPERSHDLILPADIVISFDMTNEINERSIELLSQTNKLGNKIDFR